ncbi:hypothetical protein BDN72DRAFT_846304 [Pluteus cervinus]|uniref:Uncharacterized protein n=1 Tax=Pluteus cervinus TaxID=181527 RepID=A0ACD3AFW8_9AGAR|nr:hypothetical protein BDN72DRAFT_846304 [Pluteus cervinus]
MPLTRQTIRLSSSIFLHASTWESHEYYDRLVYNAVTAPLFLDPPPRGEIRTTIVGEVLPTMLNCQMNPNIAYMDDDPIDHTFTIQLRPSTNPLRQLDFARGMTNLRIVESRIQLTNHPSNLALQTHLYDTLMLRLPVVRRGQPRNVPIFNRNGTRINANNANIILSGRDVQTTFTIRHTYSLYYLHDGQCEIETFQGRLESIVLLPN